MPFIKFTSRYTVQDEHRGTALETIYDEGEFLECSYPSARHFINRRVAVYVDALEPKYDAPPIAGVELKRDDPPVAERDDPPSVDVGLKRDDPPVTARRTTATPVKAVVEATGVRQVKVAPAPATAVAPAPASVDDADL